MKQNSEFLEKLFLRHDHNLDFIEDLVVYLNSPFSLLENFKYKYDYELKSEIIRNFLEKVDPLNDKENTKKYLMSSLRIKDASQFKENRYLQLLKNIKIDENDWKLEEITINPFEIFVCGDAYCQGDDNKYFASLGAFKEKYSFPSLSLCGREWMSLSPNEIETMNLPIQIVNGKVLVLGLGLGYFSYMASLKDDVKEVHIVEMDKDLIDIFNRKILPNFEHKEKIFIHKDDAFSFIKKVKDKDFDFIFSDLWHDVSDGVDMYLKLKEKFDTFSYTRCLYWIEESLITQMSFYITSALRYKDDSLYEKIKKINLESIYDYRNLFTYSGILGLYGKK